MQAAKAAPQVQRFPLCYRHGLMLNPDNCCRSPLAYLLALAVGVYSLPAHKEFRFLLPALQLAMPYCGLGAAWLVEHPALAQQAKGGSGGGQGSSGVRWCALVALVLAQLPVGLYFSTVQHRHVWRFLAVCTWWGGAISFIQAS